MHLHRFPQIILGLVTSLALLAQCNKKEAATPNASSDGTGIAPAVSEKVAQVVAKVSPNSIATISEGLSPSFRAVTSRLEIGGCSFSYDEAKGASGWAALLDELLKSATPEQRKDIPPNFSFVTLFKILGLDSVAAAGSSSRQRADGSYHSRSFAYMPEGRKGLLTLSGGPAAKFLLLDVAPKDTDFGLEFSLNLKDFTRDGMPSLVNLMPAEEKKKYNEEINQPVPNLGVTTKELMEKLDIRMGLFLRLDPEKKMAVSPNAPPVPTGDALVVLDGMGWLIEALKPMFMPMLQNPQAPATVTEEAGVLTIRVKQPMAPPPTDYQPVVRFDAKADRVLIASRPALLDSVLAGQDKFTQRADYAEVWRDLPTEGNDCIFVSKRLLQSATAYADESAKTMPGATGANGAMVDKVMTWSKQLLSRSQVVVLANQPDGIMTSANLSIPVNPSSMSTLTTISTISIMASLAIPTFTKVQEKAEEAKDLRHAKEVVLALKIYAADHHGKYPEKLADLTSTGTVSDPDILQFTDPITKLPVPWIYDSKLTDSSPATNIVLASPPLKNGKRVAAFNDGSSRLITEAEFAISQAKW